MVHGLVWLLRDRAREKGEHARDDRGRSRATGRSGGGGVGVQGADLARQLLAHPLLQLAILFAIHSEIGDEMDYLVRLATDRIFRMHEDVRNEGNEKK